MFTGLIQDVGGVESVESGAEGARLRIATSLAAEIGLGDSIAVDGVCLTRVQRKGQQIDAERVSPEVEADRLEVEAMNQTLSVTTLGDLKAGDQVNLELAMKASDRLGGHIVQGHVDGVGEVVSIAEDGFARCLRVALEPELARYVVEKGSIALNGVSLTVAALGEGWVEVSLIPETLERTGLGELAPGDRLNVECDIVAKYVERIMGPLAGKEQA
ncbi:MAG TPA: riboflavin synthase [Solirubrobacterales bacterium]